MKTRSMRWCLLPTAALFAAGCMDSPRNGQVVSKRTPVALSGVTLQPDAFVAVQAFDFVQKRWEDLAQGVRSGTSPATDAAGHEWFMFEGSFVLPQSPEYWQRQSAVGSQRRVIANVAGHNPAEGYLTTFDTDANPCIEQNWPSGLWTVMSNCGSGVTGAFVSMNCGKADQDCCIAHNVGVASRCDNGRLCDSAGFCSIPSGGLNQPCNANGSCNSGDTPLACVAGTCRDTTIEGLPLVTLDLRLTTCNDSGWLSNNSGSRLWVNLGTSDFFVEVPGAELGPSTTSTFGISPARIKRLRDITKLDIGIRNRDLCLTRAELLANNKVIFSKSFSPTEFMRGTNPFHEDHLVFSQDELRADWTVRSQNTHCTSPSRFSGVALERKITGLVGNALITSTQAKGDFDGNGGRLRLTRLNASTVRATTRFEGTKFIEGIGNVTADIDGRFDTSITCSGSLGQAVISANASPFTVTDVSGNLALNVLDVFTVGIAGLIASITIESEINDNLGGLNSTLGTLAKGLPICPPLAFDTATTPPDLVIGSSASINMCKLP